MKNLSVKDLYRQTKSYENKKITIEGRTAIIKGIRKFRIKNNKWRSRTK